MVEHCTGFVGKAHDCAHPLDFRPQSGDQRQIGFAQDFCGTGNSGTEFDGLAANTCRWGLRDATKEGHAFLAAVLADVKPAFAGALDRQIVA